MATGTYLNWNEADMMRLGNCSEDLKTIVHCTLPDTRPEERKSFREERNYVLNQRGVDELKGLRLPRNEHGYAAEYIEITKPIPGVKSVQRLVKKFERWVAKEEFKKIADESREKENRGDKGANVISRWFGQLSDAQRDRKCATCPLNMGSKYGNACSQELFYRYDSFKGFLDFLTKFDGFAILSRSLFREDETLICVERLGELEKELERSRTILESSTVSAIHVYDMKRKLIETVQNTTNQLFDIATVGSYVVGLDDKVNAIGVLCRGRDLFKLPAYQKKHVLNKELERRLNDLRDRIPKKRIMYFSEIYREGDTIYGKLESGRRVELPPIQIKKMTLTPFTPICDIFRQEKEIERLEYGTVSAWKGFGHAQEILEKYLVVAKEKNIPIQFS